MDLPAELYHILMTRSIRYLLTGLKEKCPDGAEQFVIRLGKYL